MNTSLGTYTPTLKPGVSVIAMDDRLGSLGVTYVISRLRSSFNVPTYTLFYVVCAWRLDE